MGLALQMIVLCIIVTLRSAGSSIAPSPSIFHTIPPVEVLPGPVIPINVNAPPPAFVPNGSKLAPSPSILTAIPPVEGLPVIPINVDTPPPVFVPNVSHTTPVLPPVNSAPGPETGAGKETAPTLPPNIIPPLPLPLPSINSPPPLSSHGVVPPPSADSPPPLPANILVPPPSANTPPSLPGHEVVPPPSTDTPPPLPGPELLPPPSTNSPPPSSGHELVPPPSENAPPSFSGHEVMPPPTAVSPPPLSGPELVPPPSANNPPPLSGHELVSPPSENAPPNQDPINSSPKPAPIAPVTIPTPSSSPQKSPSVDPVMPHLDPPSSSPNITAKNKAPPLQPHAPEPVMSTVSTPPPPPSRIDGTPVASPPNKKFRPISPRNSPPLPGRPDPPVQKHNALGNHSNVAPPLSPESPLVIKPQAPASLPSTSPNWHHQGKENFTMHPPSSLRLPPPPPVEKAAFSPNVNSRPKDRAAPPSPSPISKDDVVPSSSPPLTPLPRQTSLPSLSPKKSPSALSPRHAKWPLALPPPPPNQVSFLSPKSSPPGPSPSHTKLPILPHIHALPPPPPNKDCSALTCAQPYTNTPPGSPCNCVLPMQVGLRLGVALYTFFPLVSELAGEISMGVFMRQGQIRIMGANAASQDPEKTIVLIDLVPLGEKFDKTTAYLTADRFWNKRVAIQSSLFGDYEVLYVRYPGLPPSPPSSVDVMNGEPYSGHGDNGRSVKPLGVDVSGVHHKKNRLNGSVVAIIVLSALVFLVLSIAAVWVVLSKCRHNQQGSTPPLATLPFLSKPSGIAGSVLGSVPSSETLSIRSSMAPYTGSAKTFSASDMEKATDSFNATRVIGEGGFGRVYSGVLADGTEVAVKVLKRDDQQGGREFLAEVEMLSRLHHRNLVKLIGICTEDRARCLIYELIRNGSVESHLHGVDKEIAPLDWSSRLKIALGAARALAYLHEDSSPRVIHRDFKSSNILLEDDFTPKVSDFGLARSALEEENKHISTRVMGTFGYVAPEYAMTGHLLVKSDVYSYGVVLLELLTGKKPVDMSQPPGRENLVSWARPLLTNQDGLETIIDPLLGPDFPHDSIAKVSAIASMCVQPEVTHRPFMGEVVQALKLVCNECDVARELESRSFSHEDLSSMNIDHLDTHSPVSNYDCRLDVESAFSGSGSDIYRFKRLEKEDSDSFRRHSSSGPLSTGIGDKVWHKLRNLSGGTVSEHATNFRFSSGSH